MKQKELKSKKITLATVKSFIKKSPKLWVSIHSSFDGSTDCVELTRDNSLVEIRKENALGSKGVWVVGSSRDYFKYVENETHFGIKVSNCCGCGTIWTNK